MSYLSECHALAAEWDALARVGDRCLTARGASFCQAEIIPDGLPAGVKWRLFCQLGELGTVEIFKTRPGMAEIYFSGLGPRASDDVAAHYQAVKESFFFLLSQEDIMQTEPGAMDADQQPAAIEYRAQGMATSHEIPELTPRVLADLAIQGTPSKQIAPQYGYSPATIDNKISQLRAQGLVIPDRSKTRRKKHREK